MTNHPSALAVLMFAGFATLAAAGTDKDLSAAQVPQAVREAFQKAYPAARDAKYSEKTEDGKILYEVEFKEGGRDLEATYGAEGSLMEIEEEIQTSGLPEAVGKAIQKAHPHASIKEAEKVFRPDGTLSGYEVEVTEGHKKLELHLDAAGTIAKTEDEED